MHGFQGEDGSRSDELAGQRGIWVRSKVVDPQGVSTVGSTLLSAKNTGTDSLHHRTPDGAGMEWVTSTSNQTQKR